MTSIVRLHPLALLFATPRLARAVASPGKAGGHSVAGLSPHLRRDIGLDSTGPIRGPRSAGGNSGTLYFP